MYKYTCFALLLCCVQGLAYAQTSVKGVVTDATTNTALTGATIKTSTGAVPVITNSQGQFTIKSSRNIDSLVVSYAGYADTKVAVSHNNLIIALQPTFINLNEVVVSAAREAQARQEVPVAINVISKTTITDTKATRLDMLLNK